MAQSGCVNSVPHFAGVRRVPLRYQRLLSLEFMKHCDCAILGSAPGVLTVAVTDPDNKLLLITLKFLTGYEIFPVFVNDTRMKILLQRLERNLRHKVKYPRLAYVVYLL